jgi:hypothetical protein
MTRANQAAKVQSVQGANKVLARSAWFFLFGAAGVLAGCPIYDDEPGDLYRVCNEAGCFDCSTPYYSEWDCSPVGSPSRSCTYDTECASNELCSRGYCTAAIDCSARGCPTGYVCTLRSGRAVCDLITGDPAAPDSGKPLDASSDTGPRDGAADGAPSGCRLDSECAATGSGARCLNGTCTPAADLCADATQCVGSNSLCVDGVCATSCDGNRPCPRGYACNTSTKACTGIATSCTKTADCSGTDVCAEGRCVESCAADASTCDAGSTCIAGACVVDEKPRFQCTTEGSSQGCQQGSICLHRSCYVTCQADAGDADCRNVDRFNTCKAVTTGTGTYNVCGSSSNLGSECDPTAGKNCAAPAVCIDGFCR